MWARVSRFAEPKDRVDDDIRNSREAARELVEQSQGSEGVYYLVDRETGLGMAVTLWESEQAMRDSERVAARIREAANAQVQGEILGVEHYEVVVQPSDVMSMRR